MAWGNTLTAEVETSQDVKPVHAQFPPVIFDATKHSPQKALFAEITTPEERLRELEERAKDQLTPEAQLGIQTLVEIAGNKFLSESARVRAAALLLERFDVLREIAALRAAVAELQQQKSEEFEHA